MLPVRDRGWSSRHRVVLPKLPYRIKKSAACGGAVPA
jgi:hypothetical protein